MTKRRIFSSFILLFTFATAIAQDKVEIEYLSVKKYQRLKINEIELDPHFYGVEDITEEDFDAILFEFNGTGPEGTDEEREKDWAKSDSTMNAIGNFAQIEGVNTFIFYVGEAKFLKSTDGLVEGTNEYLKMQSTLNYDRFVERYQAIINAHFQGKRVIYLEWGW
jgi:hypothetical protein